MKKLLIALFAMTVLTANAQSLNRNPSERHDYPYGMEAGKHRDHNTNYLPPASKEEADMVKKLIKKENFDDDRLNIAKVCLALRPMFAADIEDIAKCFSFEDGKMNFLKYAYPYCVDKENAARFSRLFTFNSDSEAWIEFVKKYDKENRPKRM